MKKRNKLNMLALNKRLIKELEQKEPITKKVGFAVKTISKAMYSKYSIKNQF